MLAPISFVEDRPLFQLTLLLWWRMAILSRCLCTVGTRCYSSRVTPGHSTRGSTSAGSLHFLAQVATHCQPQEVLQKGQWTSSGEWKQLPPA